ncbi:transporter [Microbispora triticiradicis]|uniref:Transporter n=3 Tax=Microbispora TaxID=2005 RepID=A0ABY3LUC2_9ACTN|nr:MULTISPECIES: ABC-2 family transporter protein [Microbispora]RGA03430.1 transporter [Microbispora triticiradicis]TLP59495.1 transporter [Microbispora fusca]TYB54261.1 transporter [Microbispora tritici]
MIRTYALLVWAWTRAAAQYRVSFALMAAGAFVIGGLDIAVIWVIFANTDSLAGFGPAEVMFLYGTSELAFATSDMLFGNVDRISQHIKAGTLDVMLVRPVATWAQVAADRFGPHRIGRVVMAAAVLGVALARLDIPLGRAWMVPVMVVSGIVIFTSMFTLGGALQFLLTDAPEVANAFTYGGAMLNQYPLSVYDPRIVQGLTYVLPLAFVNWRPGLYVLDRPDPLGLPSWTGLLSPAAALALAAVAALAWRAGIRRYRSTGS